MGHFLSYMFPVCLQRIPQKWPDVMCIKLDLQQFKRLFIGWKIITRILSSSESHMGNYFAIGQISTRPTTSVKTKTKLGIFLHTKDLSAHKRSSDLPLVEGQNFLILKLILKWTQSSSKDPVCTRKKLSNLSRSCIHSLNIIYIYLLCDNT